MRTKDRRSAAAENLRARAGASSVGLAALVAAGAAAAVLLVVRLGVLLPAEPRTVGVDRWVELGVVAGGAVAAAWLALSALLALACVAAACLGRSWHTGEAALRRIAPGAVQRMARTAVGVGVGAGLVLVPATAYATPGADELPAPPPPAATVPLDLGWQPTSEVVDAVDTSAAPEALAGTETKPSATELAPAVVEPAAPVERKEVERNDVARNDVDRSEVELTASTTAAPTSAEQHRPHQGADDGTVVVHRGDTLWSIAAATLHGDATDTEILRAVVRWHETNRDVIGGDPDIILPGQVLRAPA